VVAVNLIEVGKTDGPEVLVRFKICKAGSTDWVGWIMGARCIVSPARGGLGSLPMEDSYSFTALGINTERIERKAGPKPDHCYAVRLSTIDSDSEEGGAEASGTVTAVGGIPLQSVPSPEPAACTGTPSGLRWGSDHVR